MKYIKVASGVFREVDDAEFTAWQNAPEANRPTFLAESNAEVKAYFAAQAEAAKPKEVTMRQARLALLQAGLLDKVAAAIAGMPKPKQEAAQIEWEYSNSLKRSQPLTVELGAALGLDTTALDALFLKASKI